MQRNNFGQCCRNCCARPTCYCKSDNTNHLRWWNSAQCLNRGLYKWGRNSNLPMEPCRRSNTRHQWCDIFYIHTDSVRFNWDIQLHRNHKHFRKWLYRKYLYSDFCSCCSRPNCHSSLSNTNALSKCHSYCLNCNSIRGHRNFAIPMV